MVVLSPEAAQQLLDLERHYEGLDRLEAIKNLLLAVEAAKARISRSPAAGLPAPRAYPGLKALGLRWVLERRYWISYTPSDPPVITAIFFETANIPGRV